MVKIVLNNTEPSSMNPKADELANIVIDRMGLNPRKKGSTDKMFRTLIELYERMKKATQSKKPEEAVMTVEEMGAFAGITRQTMYDYLKRWTALDLIIKNSYIYEGKVIIGYKLNGINLENAFEKAFVKIKNSLEATQKYVKELQKSIKNEKLSQRMKQKE